MANSTASLGNHTDVISNHMADVMLILLCICTKKAAMNYVILAFNREGGMCYSLFKGPHQKLSTRYDYNFF